MANVLFATVNWQFGSELLNGKAAVLGIEVFRKPEVGLRGY
jgi:hypothetical protein